MSVIQTTFYGRFWPLASRKASVQPIQELSPTRQSAHLQVVPLAYLEKAAIANLGPITAYHGDFKRFMKQAYLHANQYYKASVHQAHLKGESSQTVTRITHPKLVAYISMGWNHPPVLLSNQAQWDAFKQRQADWQTAYPASKTHLAWHSVSSPHTNKNDTSLFCPPNIFVIDEEGPIPSQTKAEET